METMSGLNSKFSGAQLASALGHSADVALVAVGAFGARLAAKLGARAWQSSPEIATFLAGVTRKAVVYTLGIETGVMGNLQKLTDDFSFSFGHVGDRIANGIISELDARSDALHMESLSNSHQLGNLSNKWKEGDCDRFN